MPSPGAINLWSTDNTHIQTYKSRHGGGEGGGR